jgi:hypothetical protein
MARDFKEETLLNSAEFYMLRELAGQMGLSKSATLRLALLQLGDNFLRKQRCTDTRERHEDLM